MPLFKTTILLFIFLAIATFTCLFWIDRYQQIGPDLLPHQWTAATFEKNRVDISDDTLTLFSQNPRIITNAQQYLPAIERGSILLFTAEMKSDNVIPGRKPWNQARLLLVQNDGKKDRWNLPLTVATLHGTNDWDTYQNFFYITPQTQSVRVIAELSHSVGSFQIRNMQLFPVRETGTYLLAKKLILISWGIFFAVLVGSCLFAEKKSALFRAVLTCAFISIIIGTSLPGYMKTSVVYEVETQIDVLSPVFADIVPWEITKIWHACIFLILGMILSLMTARVPFVQVMTIIMMMAAGTEMIQLYIDGRTPLISDFFIDSIGGFIGALIIKLVGRNKPFSLTKHAF
ncbi:MAG: VanZ family protein [Nitrosomonas sp.]|nr:MAG: VanZ family protein [Nitrosomonas sp.]